MKKVIIFAFIMVLLAVTFSVLHAVVFGGQEPSEIKKELTEKVTDLLKKGDSVQIRKNVDDFFRLGDIFFEEGNNEDAVFIYTRALEVNAWRFDYQLRLAALLMKKKDTHQAMSIAKSIYELAEDESLIVQAEELLKTLDGKYLESVKAKDASRNQGQIENAAEIMLVPIGTVNIRLLAELRKGLEQSMGIRVSISETSLGPGKFEGSYAVQYIKNVFEKISSSLSVRNREQLLRAARLKKAVLDTDENKIKFIKAYLDNVPEGDKARKDFETNLNSFSNQGQYDVDKLIARLKQTFLIDEKSPVRGYLGITELDLFGGDSNFRFAGAIKDYGVVSYARYKADFNGEGQNRVRLLERTLKQSVSSTLFIVDIPRCITPTCSHGYANSLAEHDLKNVEICPICRERFDKWISDTKSSRKTDQVRSAL